MTDNDDNELAQKWYETKTDMMVAILGTEHNVVMHALIPYCVGGGLDLYYFPNGISGTAIATKELCEKPGEGSTNDVLDDYELVMFTRHVISLDDAKDQTTPFGAAHHSINAILSCIAPYSAQAKLNPKETCEFPEDMEELGGRCLVFDAFKPLKEHNRFGLLLILEIYRSEMNFARENGGQQLIDKLSAAGYYPYSDLDRPPVA